MRTRLLLSATLGTLASMAPAFAAEDVVSVDGLAIPAAGNLKVGDVTSVHLKAAAGLGYDSNVYSRKVSIDGASAETVSDEYAIGKVGAVAISKPTQNISVNLDTELGTEHYFKYANRSAVIGKVGASVAQTAPTHSESVNGSWTRNRDPLIDMAPSFDQALHDDYTLGGLIGNRGSSTIVEAGAGFARTKFLDTHEDRDRNVVSAMGRLGYAYGKDTNAYVKVLFDHTTYTNDATSLNNSNMVTGLVGGQYAVGVRTQAFGEAGLSHRTYSNGFRGVGSDDTVNAPAFNLGLNWNYEEGSSLRWSAFSRVEDGQQSNAAVTYGTTLDVRHRLANKVTGLAGGQLYQTTDSEASGTNDKQKRVTADLKAGAEYIFVRGLAGRLQATYTKSTVNNDVEGFNRVGVVGEAAYVF